LDIHPSNVLLFHKFNFWNNVQRNHVHALWLSDHLFFHVHGFGQPEILISEKFTKIDELLPRHFYHIFNLNILDIFKNFTNLYAHQVL